MNAPTHYDTLNVARNAPPEVIRAAYKVLAQKYHPDRNPGDAKAAEKMKAINAAYEVLSDAQKRREYDIRLNLQETGSQQRTQWHTQTQTPPPHAHYSPPPFSAASGAAAKASAAAQKRTQRARARPARRKKGVLPWQRFFARTVDLYLAFLLLFFLAKLLPAQAMEMLPRAMQPPFLLFVPAALCWMLMEPVFLARCGATPGKWLFGLRVQHADGTRLSFSEAFTRTWRASIQGAGLAFLPVAVFTLAFAYRRFERSGTTLWDASACTVTHRPQKGALRAHAGMLAVLAPFILQAILLLLASDQLHEPFRPVSLFDGRLAFSIAAAYLAIRGVIGCMTWLEQEFAIGKDGLFALLSGSGVVLFCLIVMGYAVQNTHGAISGFWLFSFAFYAVARLLWQAEWLAGPVTQICLNLAGDEARQNVEQLWPVMAGFCIVVALLLAYTFDS